MHWIIDGREVGDPIVIIDHQSNKSETTPKEFEELMERNRNRTWTIKDYSGGLDIPDPDDK